MFLEQGFEAATMDVVAAAAGVSKGTLYARFASKDALLKAAIEDLLERLHVRSSATDDQLPSELGPRLREYARKLVATFEWSEYVQLNRLVVTASQADPEIGQRWLDAISSGYTRLIAREMESAAGTMARPDVNWLALANLFTYGVSGWHRSAMLTNSFSPERFEEYCGVVADTIVTASTRIAPKSNVPR